MKHLKLLLGMSAIVGGCGLLSLSVSTLHAHFQSLKDVQEYSLPLAAELPPLEHRAKVLDEELELSELQASMRSPAADEKLRAYVLPSEDKTERLLAFLESLQTFLERRNLVKSISPITLGDWTDSSLAMSESDRSGKSLREREIRFEAVLRPEGRDLLLQIIGMSGMLTVGDVLTPEDIRKLFTMTESENHAGIVPVERFLASDLLDYAQDPTLPDQRLSQALASEEMLSKFRAFMNESDLPAAKELLTGPLGRTLVARKLWPTQFMTVEDERYEEMEEGWVKAGFVLKTYGR